MTDIFGSLARDWHEIRDHLPHHRDDADAVVTQAPAEQPDSTAQVTQEDPMSLITLTDDLKEDLTEGVAYVKDWIARVEQAAPGIAGTLETVGGSTVGKLAEELAGFVVPEPYEGMLVNLVKDWVGRYGQPAASTAPATPQEPQEPVAPSGQ